MDAWNKSGQRSESDVAPTHGATATTSSLQEVADQIREDLTDDTPPSRRNRSLWISIALTVAGLAALGYGFSSIAEYAAVRGEHDALVRARDELREDVVSQRIESARVDADIQERSETLTELIARVESNQRAEELAEQDAAAARQVRSEALDTAERLRAEAGQLNTEIEASQTRKAELSRSIAQLIVNRDQLQKSVGELEVMQSTLEATLTAIDRQNALLARVRAESEQISSEAGDLQEQRTRLRAQVASLQTKVDAAQQLDLDLTDREARLSVFEQQIATHRKGVTDLRARSEMFAADVAAKRTRAAGLDTRIGEGTKTEATLTESVAALRQEQQSLRAALLDTRGLLGTARQELATTRTDLLSAQQDLASTEGAASEAHAALERLAPELTQLRTRAAAAADARDALVTESTNFEAAARRARSDLAVLQGQIMAAEGVLQELDRRKVTERATLNQLQNSIDSLREQQKKLEDGR